MDKQTIIEKVKALETRFDLLNLLNEVKVDLLGLTAYPFTMKKLLILCKERRRKKARALPLIFNS